MKRETLQSVIEGAWDAETSASKETWSPQNRALGQCAVTACVVNDYLGGEIVNSVATLPDGTPDSHYYNVIDGEEVDITKSQFPDGTTFTPGAPKTKGYDTTRDYVLSHIPTNERYELLKSRVANKLT
jgi:hypothetical protein